MELLVVILIIAVLSGIAMSNVSKYFAKSRNASITSNLANVQTYGGVYVYENGNFNNFFSDPKVVSAINSITNAHGIVNYYATSDEWCLCSSTIYDEFPLKTICVDSTGYKKETDEVFCTRRCDGAFNYSTCRD